MRIAALVGRQDVEQGVQYAARLEQQQPHRALFDDLLVNVAVDLPRFRLVSLLQQGMGAGKIPPVADDDRQVSQIGADFRVALAVHPPHRIPAALNGFGLWNVIVLGLMLLAYGFPIAQFIIDPSPSAMVHRMH